MKILIFFCSLILSLSSFANELQVVAEYSPYDNSTLYYPNDGKSHPGILILHGSEGGSLANTRVHAMQLAHQGYAVLAYCWYNCMKDVILGVTDTLENLNINKAYEAFLWLKESKYVGGKKTALYGISRGAELALLMGWKLSVDKLVLPDAIAVHAPSDFAVNGFNWTVMDKRCWICNSLDMACFNGSDVVSKWDLKNARFNPACGEMPKPFDQIVAWTWNGTGIVGNTRIEIENFKNPVFITHGMADPLWQVERSKRIQKTLEDAGLKPEVHLYEGEGHSFKFPAENDRKEKLLVFLKKQLE